MCLRLEDGRDATSRKKRGGAVKASPTHDETDTACREYIDIFLKRRATLANKIAFYDTSLEMERFTRYISPTRGGGGDGG